MVNVRNIIKVLITFTYYVIADTFSFQIYGTNLLLSIKKLILMKLELEKNLKEY